MIFGLWLRLYIPITRDTIKEFLKLKGRLFIFDIKRKKKTNEKLLY